jgi:hypothetical protein
LELIFISNTTSSNTASKYPTAFVRPSWRSCRSATANHARQTSLCVLKNQVLLSLRSCALLRYAEGTRPETPDPLSVTTAHRRAVLMSREGAKGISGRTPTPVSPVLSARVRFCTSRGGRWPSRKAPPRYGRTDRPRSLCPCWVGSPLASSLTFTSYGLFRSVSLGQPRWHPAQPLPSPTPPRPNTSAMGVFGDRGGQPQPPALPLAVVQCMLCSLRGTLMPSSWWSDRALDRVSFRSRLPDARPGADTPSSTTEGPIRL